MRIQQQIQQLQKEKEQATAWSSLRKIRKKNQQLRAEVKKNKSQFRTTNGVNEFQMLLTVLNTIDKDVSLLLEEKVNYFWDKIMPRGIIVLSLILVLEMWCIYVFI